MNLVKINLVRWCGFVGELWQETPAKLISPKSLRGAIFYEDRTINNSIGDSVGGPIDGDYDLFTHVWAINFNYRF